LQIEMEKWTEKKMSEWDRSNRLKPRRVTMQKEKGEISVPQEGALPAV